MNTSQAFALAVQHHLSGRLRDAEALYRQILAVQPGHAEARHYLGVIAHQVGRHELAVDYIRQSLALEQNNAAAYTNLGEAYRMLGRIDEAKESFHRALQLDPRDAKSWSNLGNTLMAQGLFHEAIDAYRQSLQIQPDFVEAHNNIGNALSELGKAEEALAAYRRAIEIQPGFAEGHYNLGNLLREQNRLEEAATAYRRALELKPDHVDAENNLGRTRKKQGRTEEAIAAYRRALALNPDYAPAHNNLGNALAELGHAAEALAAFRRAVTLNPRFPEIHVNLGNALRECGAVDEAIAAYARALQMRPDFAEAHSNLGVALAGKDQIAEAISAYQRALELDPHLPDAHLNLGNALREQGHLDEGLAEYRRTIELKPDYPEAYINLGNALMERGELDGAISAYRSALEMRPSDAALLSDLIFVLPLCPDVGEEIIREEQARWNRLHVPRSRTDRHHKNDPDPARRLRIGYVSPDFRTHAVSFFTVPLLEAHNHEHYEIFCYASVRRPDAITERVRKAADVWCDVRTLSDAGLVERVREDRIDILVDLSMHTADNRLVAFAHHPAPVQVSWLAYPGTTGVEAIDYRLSDAHLHSLNDDADHSGGEIVRLPDSWCCYEPIGEFPLVGPLPATQNGVVTFGSLNRFNKIHESRLRCWARLLSGVPNSRLLMICPAGEAQARTLGILAAEGIASERVELVAPAPWPAYIRLFERVDIALDAFPCNGMTTVCHALWMGVPVVTQSGATAMSRAAGSLLHTMGLPQWIARDEDEIVRLAAAAAADVPQLAGLRASLRSRMQASVLMDAARFARHMEASYRTMWQRWCTAHPFH